MSKQVKGTRKHAAKRTAAGAQATAERQGMWMACKKKVKWLTRPVEIMEKLEEI